MVRKVTDRSDPGLNRRRFLAASLLTSLGVPLLALGLEGCGSSSSDPLSSSGASGGFPQANGRVALPPGTPLILSRLSVANALGAQSVAADGQFTAAAIDTVPTLAFLSDASGRGVLFGFVDPRVAGGVLDAAATATALLYFALGCYQLPAEQKRAVLGLIAADPATARLAAVLSARIAANPYALEDGDAQVGGALRTAFAAITGGGKEAPPRSATARTRAAAPPLVLVQPSEQQSGVEVLQDAATVGVIATNHYRRRCEVYLYQTGVTDAAGNHTDAPVAGRVAPSVSLGTTTALGTSSTVANLLSGNTAFVPVSTPTLPLRQAAGAAKTFFDVVVLGASDAQKGEPAFFADPAYAQERDGWRKTVAALNIQSFLIDIAFGLVLELWGLHSLIPTDNAIRAAIDGLSALPDPSVQALVRNVSGGSLRAAVPLFLGIAARDDSVGRAVRAQLLALLRSVSQKAADAVADAYAQRALGLALKMALSALNIAGLILGAGDLGAVIHDLASANAGDRWNVVLFQPTLQLTPLTATLAAGGSQSFTAKPPAGLMGTVVYDWSTTATFAALSDGAGQTGRSFETAAATVNLLTSPSDQGTITVSVTAYQVAASGAREKIGDASATITINAKSLIVYGRFKTESYVDPVENGGYINSRVSAIVVTPRVQDAKAYSVRCYGFNDTAYFGTSITYSLTEPPHLPDYDASHPAGPDSASPTEIYHGIAGGGGSSPVLSGGVDTIAAAEAGNADAEKGYQARFAGMKVEVTVSF